ncbi:6-phosphofructokinase [Portibacter lacus]|uniref:ATP-dependent 6-phosphofructokinase n=1 Tax=Portibacter lacus TaxID=1099794 RepID=A0AA37SJA8_9BACT|nr:6-phosphofructokinase [Portibacter lacus]GLR15526.1 ATP-dependent 6-phosphofructokinase [Portibacter lacus]
MTKIKKIAVFTSGGDAPGMNAAVRAVVRTASYHNLEAFGIYRGYEGMIDGRIKPIAARDVGNIIQRGGTILKTARSMRFKTPEGRKQAYENLKEAGIDALVAIGGDGTFTGAQVFSQEYNIPIVGLPGTIDNDIYGTDYTIGFDTAINTAIEAVDKIRDTADSHSRLFFVEVMGRHSGYIALHTGIGSGAGCIFLPEYDTPLDELVDVLKKANDRDKMFNMVIVAEGNRSGNAMEIANRLNEKYDGYESKVTILGHMQRGGAPSCRDRVLASRLGYHAIEVLLKGESNVALGIINDELCLTPFQEAISQAKKPKSSMLEMARILSM